MSIPATEHSVMTCWPSEREAIANMIDHFGGGLFACVMDSYDYASVRVPHFAFVGSPRESTSLHAEKQVCQDRSLKYTCQHLFLQPAQLCHTSSCNSRCMQIYKMDC